MDAETQAKLAEIAARESAPTEDQPQPQAEPTPDPPVESKGTIYKVFHSDGEGTALGFIAEATAVNDVKAIYEVIGSNPEDGAAYVAIPARSLRVRTLKVVSQPKVVVS
jgi:hypothetical protein